ncbi:MAG: YkgJ family cysteine cluster protein [Candidatus Thorarchaeota archaeon]|nr:YkgJ family cysteine cluster protein [Candidatus Thorarchaeota archaeon]
MTEKTKYSFKCMEQTCSNRVCCTRDRVNVTLGDLSRWTTQNHIGQILPALTLVTQNEEDQVYLETKRKPLAKSPENTSCIFFIEESNGCAIRFSRPISCRTFPLQYDGEKFRVSNKACPGIGKGEVTPEALKEARALAEEEYKERLETASALPPLYALIVGEMMQQSAATMSSLSEEDRKKIQEILSKAPDGKTQDSAQGSNKD